MGDNFLLNHLILPVFKAAEPLVVAPHRSAVQPERGAGNVGQKAPVVADNHHRAVIGGNNFFQLLNRRHIEVVGRFVKKQDIGLVDQGFGKGGLATFAAGGCLRIGIGRNLQLFDPHLHFVVAAAVIFAQSRRHDRSQVRIAAEIGVLRHVADFGIRLNKDISVIGLDQSGNNFQQSRFSRTVPSDQRNFIPLIDVQFHVFKQLFAAEADFNAFQRINGRFKCRHDRDPLSVIFGGIIIRIGQKINKKLQP